MKIPRDFQSGKNRGYGFVLFHLHQTANEAMIDFKAGRSDYQLEWYKLPAEREA